MKRVIAWSFLLLLSLNTSAARPQGLRFAADGTFRIVQFTDTHLDPQTPERQAEAEKTFARIDRIIRTEHPDLLVFTGDVVTGSPAAGMWQRLLDTLSRRGVPYCVVLGNHDAEQDLSRREIARMVTSAPGSLNTLDAAGELADVELTVGGSASERVAAALYCLDSHDYSTVEGVEGYGWFDRGQIDWLRGCCDRRTRENDGEPLPALAFFHIALPEYVAAWRNPDNPRIGRAAEEECPGALNSGMFAALVESRSVMGTFVGHDHDIDYLVVEKGICLGYGRYSGDNTTYNNLRPGVRMIELHEGDHGFVSWIREDDGRVVDRVRVVEGKIVKTR